MNQRWLEDAADFGLAIAGERHIVYNQRGKPAIKSPEAEVCRQQGIVGSESSSATGNYRQRKLIGNGKLPATKASRQQKIAGNERRKA